MHRSARSAGRFSFEILTIASPALDVATGKVISLCLPKHRHIEFLKFLRTVDSNVPAGLEIHLILDNYATHKHANVKAWLAKHPRFHLHFTPTRRPG